MDWWIRKKERKNKINEKITRGKKSEKIIGEKLESKMAERNKPSKLEKNRRQFLWQRKYYMQIWQETLKTSPCPLLVIMHLLVIVFALFVFLALKELRIEICHHV